MNERWVVVVLALFYPLVIFGGASLKADYSHVSQYISELNAVGSAWSWQIGYLGFLPLGLLGFLLLLLVAPRTRLNGTSRIGCWLLVGEPIAYVSSALAPCDLGCPSTGSLSQDAHNLLAVTTLLMTTLGLVLLSLNNRLAAAKRVGWLGLAVMYITLYTIALVPEVAEWRGLLQRLAEGVLYGTLCVISWHILAGHDNSARAEGVEFVPATGRAVSRGARACCRMEVEAPDAD